MMSGSIVQFAALVSRNYRRWLIFEAEIVYCMLSSSVENFTIISPKELLVPKQNGKICQTLAVHNRRLLHLSAAKHAELDTAYVI